MSPQPLLGIVYALLVLLLLLFLFWRLWFCRRPARSVPPREEAIVSPANGRVTLVRRFDTRRLTAKKWNRASVEFLAQDVAEKGWFILIVMTPLHVHYQRAPIAGRVVSTRHAPGRFRNAVRKAGQLLTLENERNEILLSSRKGRVKVVQIAGLLARRISCYVRKDRKVEKGALLGFINLGSQVAVVLPERAEVRVAPGTGVVDGETVIATW